MDAPEKSGASRPKVVICIPTLTRPHDATLGSLKDSEPVLEAAGWDVSTVYEIGCPYISAARAKMLRKALDAKADAIVFIDHDVSWRPGDLLKILNVKDDVVAGTYRFKKDAEEYMGAVLAGLDGRPAVRPDGCISMICVPAGFLKITAHGVNRFMQAYPELCYGERFAPHVDLFNHGAHNWMWYGEDYAFSRRWTEKCGPIWLVPDLDITHHTAKVAYPGNYHRYWLRQAGGSESESPEPPKRPDQPQDGGAALSLVA